MRIFKVAGTWALQIAFGALCILVGTGKFGDPNWAHRFAAWGYPAGFYMVVGIFEIVGGLLILVPRAAVYGALIVMTVMLGAFATHLTHGEMRRLVSPLAFFTIAAVVGWLRRHDVRPSARARDREQAVV